MVDDRLGARREHLRRHRRRPRREQVALLHCAWRLAVAVEREDLLVGRTVRPAHRHRQESGCELDALPGRVCVPLRGVRPLRCGELRRPLRRSRTRGAASTHGVAARERVARERRSERGRQGLQHVPVPARRCTRSRSGSARRRAPSAWPAGPSASPAGAHHCVRNARPGRVEDRRAGIVDLAVEVRGRAVTRPRATTASTSADQLLVARVRRRRCGRATSRAPARPRPRAGPPSPPCSSTRTRSQDAPLRAAGDGAREQQRAVHRAVREVVVGRVEARRGLVIPVDDCAARRVDRLRMRARREESLPVVRAGPDRREAGSTPSRGAAGGPPRRTRCASSRRRSR